MSYGAMRWSNIFLTHFTVAPRALASRLPKGLALDLFRGAGYLSAVGMHATGPLPHAVLDTPLGALLRYQQLNLRTYVVGEEGPGIVVFDTRIDRPSLALGARLLGMPYHLDSKLDVSVDGAAASLSASDIELRGEIMADVAPGPAAGGGLESFVLNRFRIYSQAPGGLLYSVLVEHPPFSVLPVSLSTSVMPDFEPGVEIAAAAAHVAEPLEVALVEVELGGHRARAEGLGPSDALAEG
jgi:uncharacterized protein YqjF (DUF2071 family)